MYSNNILNFQESTTILNASAKMSGKVLNAPHIYIYIYIYSVINFRNRRLLLNERNVLMFKCRHRGKFKLS